MCVYTDVSLISLYANDGLLLHSSMLVLAYGIFTLSDNCEILATAGFL